MKRLSSVLALTLLAGSCEEQALREKKNSQTSETESGSEATEESKFGNGVEISVDGSSGYSGNQKVGEDCGDQDPIAINRLGFNSSSDEGVLSDLWQPICTDSNLPLNEQGVPEIRISIPYSDIAKVKVLGIIPKNSADNLTDEAEDDDRRKVLLFEDVAVRDHQGKRLQVGLGLVELPEIVNIGFPVTDARLLKAAFLVTSIIPSHLKFSPHNMTFGFALFGSHSVNGNLERYGTIIHNLDGDWDNKTVEFPSFNPSWIKDIAIDPISSTIILATFGNIGDPSKIISSVGAAGDWTGVGYNENIRSIFDVSFARYGDQSHRYFQFLAPTGNGSQIELRMSLDNNTTQDLSPSFAQPLGYIMAAEVGSNGNLHTLSPTYGDHTRSLAYSEFSYTNKNWALKTKLFDTDKDGNACTKSIEDFNLRVDLTGAVHVTYLCAVCLDKAEEDLDSDDFCPSDYARSMVYGIKRPNADWTRQIIPMPKCFKEGHSLAIDHEGNAHIAYAENPIKENCGAQESLGTVNLLYMKKMGEVWSTPELIVESLGEESIAATPMTLCVDDYGAGHIFSPISNDDSGLFHSTSTSGQWKSVITPKGVAEGIEGTSVSKIVCY